MSLHLEILYNTFSFVDDQDILKFAPISRSVRRAVTRQFLSSVRLYKYGHVSQFHRFLFVDPSTRFPSLNRLEIEESAFKAPISPDHILGTVGSSGPGPEYQFSSASELAEVLSQAQNLTHLSLPYVVELVRKYPQLRDAITNLPALVYLQLLRVTDPVFIVPAADNIARNLKFLSIATGITRDSCVEPLLVRISQFFNLETLHLRLTADYDYEWSHIGESDDKPSDIVCPSVGHLHLETFNWLPTVVRITASFPNLTSAELKIVQSCDFLLTDSDNERFPMQWNHLDRLRILSSMYLNHFYCHKVRWLELDPFFMTTDSLGEHLRSRTVLRESVGRASPLILSVGRMRIPDNTTPWSDFFRAASNVRYLALIVNEDEDGYESVGKLMSCMEDLFRCLAALPLICLQICVVRPTAPPASHQVVSFRDCFSAPTIHGDENVPCPSPSGADAGLPAETLASMLAKALPSLAYLALRIERVDRGPGNLLDREHEWWRISRSGVDGDAAPSVARVPTWRGEQIRKRVQNMEYDALVDLQASALESML